METKKMTLDEAIEHLEDTIKNKEFSCDACKDEHIQLLEWLKELKELKELRTLKEEKKMLYANYPFDM